MIEVSISNTQAAALRAINATVAPASGQQVFLNAAGRAKLVGEISEFLEDEVAYRVAEAGPNTEYFEFLARRSALAQLLEVVK